MIPPESLGAEVAILMDELDLDADGTVRAAAAGAAPAAAFAALPPLLPPPLLVVVVLSMATWHRRLGAC